MLSIREKKNYILIGAHASFVISGFLIFFLFVLNSLAQCTAAKGTKARNSIWLHSIIKQFFVIIVCWIFHIAHNGIEYRIVIISISIHPFQSMQKKGVYSSTPSAPLDSRYSLNWSIKGTARGILCIVY